MPFTKFTNLDFDQIKTSIKDYLRANSNFTDFDFEGSNFSVLIDTLAYNTYITAFNSNMVVNESFLDSATLRENVVSLARNVGYVPRSRSAARAGIYFTVPTTTTSPTLTLKAGLVCTGSIENTSYTFSIPENITTTVVNGVATFGSSTTPIDVYQGTFLTKQFIVDGSLDQRFILENSFIDSSTIVVYVKGINDTGLGREYSKVDNILQVKASSEIYLIQEVQDEKYELLFGDGYFGKKLENGSVITATYIITDGRDGNGASSFTFAGSLVDSEDNIIIPTNTLTINTQSKADNGGDIEPLSSIKYFAPRLYSAQYRAVTARDYEAIIQQIYPNTESVSVVGGEELTPPRFGKVLISIKPKNGDFVSDFDKQFILSRLKQYSLSGINQEIVDLQILYVEIDSSIYYNTSQVSSVDNLKTSVTNSLTNYSSSVDLNKFGGRFKYSKLLQVIDQVDDAITSNITKIIIRRNLKALINQFAQYELCFGNKFHINLNGYNIKSTGFTIAGSSDVVYLTDIPNKNLNGELDGSGKGIISVVRKDAMGDNRVVVKSAGTVDYTNGEIILNTINITSTLKPDNIIEVQAFPESNDVVGLTDLYLSFDVSKSKINMVKDVISSGEDISGITFTRDYYTSSYSNGDLERK
jgi:hypothetical protein